MATFLVLVCLWKVWSFVLSLLECLFSMLLCFLRPHVSLPGPIVMWNRLVGTINLQAAASAAELLELDDSMTG